MKLPHDQQIQLLRLQELETEVVQVAERIRSSQAVQLAEDLKRRSQNLRADLVRARTESEDLARAIKRAEEDVRRLQERKRHDEQMLGSGVNAKVQRELAHESQALERRIQSMEDAELELLENQETTERQIASLEGERIDIEARLLSAEQDRDAEISGLGRQQTLLESQIREIVDGISAEVLARYRSSRNATGVAAAVLQKGQCLGCRLSLPPGTAADLESKPLDELENCEECGCLLVRGVSS